MRHCFTAFVYPYILYGIEIYANTFITYLDTLTKLNNKFYISRFVHTLWIYIDNVICCP